MKERRERERKKKKESITRYNFHFSTLTSVLCPFQLSQEIQCAVVSHIQSLVKSEKSRQVMCGAGLLSTIVTSCQGAFLNENHPLHLPLTRVFEKLASQAIEPDVLRYQIVFIRTNLV